MADGYDDFKSAPDVGAAYDRADRSQADPTPPEQPSDPLDHPIHRHDLSEWAPSPGGSIEQSVNQVVSAQSRRQTPPLQDERHDPGRDYIGRLDDTQQRMIDQIEAERMAGERHDEDQAKILSLAEEAEQREAFRQAMKSAEVREHLQEVEAKHAERLRAELEQEFRVASAEELAAEQEEERRHDPGYDMPDDPGAVQAKDREELGLDPPGPGFYDHNHEWDHEAEESAHQEYLDGQKAERGTHDGPAADDGWSRGGSDGGHER